MRGLGVWFQSDWVSDVSLASGTAKRWTVCGVIMKEERLNDLQNVLIGKI